MPQLSNGKNVTTVVKVKLSGLRTDRLEEKAAYKGLSVGQYVSELVDAALADERSKLREESIYASNALLAIENIY